MAPPRQQRVVNGMEKCNSILACSYIDGKKFKWKEIPMKNWKSPIMCSKNIVYICVCDKDNYKKQYKGLTQDLR